MHRIVWLLPGFAALGASCKDDSVCAELAERYRVCWQSVPCSVLADATARTTCETTRDAFATPSSGDEEDCTAAARTAAESCLAGFRQSTPQVLDTTLEVAQYCGCTGTPRPDPHATCVEIINRLRATAQLPPYARWSAGELCADKAAAADAAAGKPHSAFGSCGEPAQNVCPDRDGGVSALEGCLSTQWSSKPSGVHQALASVIYTKVACGLFVTAQGKLWAVQNFAK